MAEIVGWVISLGLCLTFAVVFFVAWVRAIDQHTGRRIWPGPPGSIRRTKRELRDGGHGI